MNEGIFRGNFKETDCQLCGQVCVSRVHAPPQLQIVNNSTITGDRIQTRKTYRRRRTRQSKCSRYGSSRVVFKTQEVTLIVGAERHKCRLHVTNGANQSLIHGSTQGINANLFYPKVKGA